MSRVWGFSKLSRSRHPTVLVLIRVFSLASISEFAMSLLRARVRLAVRYSTTATEDAPYAFVYKWLRANPVHLNRLMSDAIGGGIVCAGRLQLSVLGAVFPDDTRRYTGNTRQYVPTGPCQKQNIQLPDPDLDAANTGPIRFFVDVEAYATPACIWHIDFPRNRYPYETASDLKHALMCMNVFKYKSIITPTGLEQDGETSVEDYYEDDLISFKKPKSETAFELSVINVSARAVRPFEAAAALKARIELQSALYKWTRQDKVHVEPTNYAICNRPRFLSGFEWSRLAVFFGRQGRAKSAQVPKDTPQPQVK